ncbi:MAG: glycosyltransferase [Firmicutes bacterium]|jgi:glycosyltransferase involved in cell wall biosynthesis|nr:glycosyltransferase [Bacillota bacterium]HQD39673.1 glycosyltransferase family 4 protein [Bacillota bacterium]
MPFRFSVLSTFPPRQCGIATYCYDLLTHLPSLAKPEILAICEEKEQSTNQFKFSLEQQNRTDYLQAAAVVNKSKSQLVHIQHEFGIFGGQDGRYLLDFLAHLQKPAVTTFHTVLATPDPNKFKIMQRIAQSSTKVIVMAERAKEILVETYQINPEKICIFHHGVPAPCPLSRDELKKRMGLEGREVISTFGLLSRGKGIEYAIKAVAKAKELFPEVCYLIIGRTHPGVQKYEGEEYRHELMKLTARLGLEDNIQFVDRFLDKKELVEYLTLTDIYLTPYIGREQITSGTLAYAVGLGKAVVSTPYFYAQELLAQGRGMLAEFKDSDSIADCLIRILASPELQAELEGRAAQLGKYMSWNYVAEQHLALYCQVASEHSYSTEALLIPGGELVANSTQT